MRYGNGAVITMCLLAVARSEPCDNDALLLLSPTAARYDRSLRCSMAYGGAKPPICLDHRATRADSPVGCTSTTHRKVVPYLSRWQHFILQQASGGHVFILPVTPLVLSCNVHSRWMVGQVGRDVAHSAHTAAAPDFTLFHIFMFSYRVMRRFSDIRGMGPRQRGLHRGIGLGQAETGHLHSHNAAIGENMKSAPDLQVLCASFFANLRAHSSLSCQIMEY